MKNGILKFGILLMCALVLNSCSNEDTAPLHVKESPENPNANTREEYLQTHEDPTYDGVISKLISDMKIEKFELEKGDFHPHNSFYDVEEEVTYILRGNGMKAYSFKRTEAKPDYYYPDFLLTVFEFKTESDAREGLEKIKASMGGRNEFIKAPYITARNKREVFYLDTRAEMFRGYIEDAAKRLKAY